MALHVKETDIPDVKILIPDRFGDQRGFFSEVYSLTALTRAGLRLDFVQDNHSLSAEAGTVRGLHYQSAPSAQDKLVRVVRGRILDVAVDIRRSSSTFGQHVAVELSAENWHQLLVPIGFAHGFCTLEPNSEVLYKVTSDYDPTNDHGIAWDDPTLGIDWPVGRGQAVLSIKDQSHPAFVDARHLFS